MPVVEDWHTNVLLKVSTVHVHALLCCIIIIIILVDYVEMVI